MGYKVVAHYHTENEITKDLKEKYPQVKFIQADFATKDGFMNFIDQAMANDSRYDVLVNATVINIEKNGSEQQRIWESWHDSYSVNLISAGILMAHAQELLNKNGVIINISSTHGQPHMGEIEYTIYASTKAALNSLTIAYAKRYSPNIRVVGIGPGWTRSWWNKDMSENELNDMISPQLTHKLVEPKEIAELMEQVIKNKSINATTLIIDGGLSAPII